MLYEDFINDSFIYAFIKSDIKQRSILINELNNNSFNNTTVLENAMITCIWNSYCKKESISNVEMKETAKYAIFKLKEWRPYFGFIYNLAVMASKKEISQDLSYELEKAFLSIYALNLTKVVPDIQWKNIYEIGFWELYESMLNRFI